MEGVLGVQILGLREYTDPKTGEVRLKHAFFEKKWRADSVTELFKNLPKYLAKIPKEEHYNLYYTAAVCLETSKRELLMQDIIPFDIDNIDLSKIEEYITVFLKTLNLKREETGIVATGNGLQFIIGIEEHIEEEEYFDHNRAYYKGVCGNLANAFFSAGLPCNVDVVVFGKARLLRLPSTENRKKKGIKQAVLMQANIKKIPFDLVKLSGIPVVLKEHQVTDTILNSWPPPDTAGVIDGCPFLQWARDNQNDVSEPQWYAMLSIIGRLHDGIELARAFSMNADNYSEAMTDRKRIQALEASGPRTCSSIALTFDGCDACPNFHNGCTSPIQLKGEEYIKTEGTGFWTEVYDAKTQVSRPGKPAYDDLLKYFERNQPFITIEEGLDTYIWTGKKWEDYPHTRMFAYAEDKFKPKPIQSMCNEFKFKIQRNNIRNVGWFENTQGLMNFQNGVLDMDTMEVLPHDKKRGFKYVLPYDYDPTADCPRFDKFLKEITVNDPELSQVLLEYMGYSLSGIDPNIGSKALILTGDGSNGKSVFMDVLKFLAGKGNYSSLNMGKELNKMENRYQLDGMLFNASEETPTDALLDSTTFKAIVAGGEVQARKLFSNPYSMKNNAKIIMACNELPKNKDNTHGLYRRLLIIPFLALFSERDESYDPLIRDKLYVEASGIMNRVIKALLVFKKNQRFSSSYKVSQVLADYKDDNDTVNLWWQSRIVEDGSNKVPISTFYNMYKIDQEELGCRPLNSIGFSKGVRRIVDKEQLKKRRVEGNVQLCIIGYRLATGDDDDEVQN